MQRLTDVETLEIFASTTKCILQYIQQTLKESYQKAKLFYIFVLFLDTKVTKEKAKAAPAKKGNTCKLLDHNVLITKDKQYFCHCVNKTVLI